MLLCVRSFMFYLRHWHWIAESGWWCRDYNVALLYLSIKRKGVETEGEELEFCRNFCHLPRIVRSKHYNF